MSDNRTEHEIREDAAASARAVVFALRPGDVLTVRAGWDRTTGVPTFDIEEAKRRD